MVRLARGVRLHHDRVRERWVLLAPERVMILNPAGKAIAELCDGRGVDAIAEALAGRFDAPRDRIERDVAAFLGELRQRRMLE